MAPNIYSPGGKVPAQALGYMPMPAYSMADIYGGIIPNQPASSTDPLGLMPVSRPTAPTTSPMAYAQTQPVPAAVRAATAVAAPPAPVMPFPSLGVLRAPQADIAMNGNAVRSNPNVDSFGMNTNGSEHDAHFGPMPGHVSRRHQGTMQPLGGGGLAALGGLPAQIADRIAAFRSQSGRSYTPGQTYHNASGSYVAQPDGSFRRSA